MDSKSQGMMDDKKINSGYDQRADKANTEHSTRETQIHHTVTTLPDHTYTS